jgi:hypothetical protein
MLTTDQGHELVQVVETLGEDLILGAQPLQLEFQLQ